MANPGAALTSVLVERAFEKQKIMWRSKQASRAFFEGIPDLERTMGATGERFPGVPETPALKPRNRLEDMSLEPADTNMLGNIMLDARANALKNMEINEPVIPAGPPPAPRSPLDVMAPPVAPRANIPELEEQVAPLLGTRYTGRQMGQQQPNGMWRFFDMPKASVGDSWVETPAAQEANSLLKLIDEQKAKDASALQSRTAAQALGESMQGLRLGAPPALSEAPAVTLKKPQLEEITTETKNSVPSQLKALFASAKEPWHGIPAEGSSDALEEMFKQYKKPHLSTRIEPAVGKKEVVRSTIEDERGKPVELVGKSEEDLIAKLFAHAREADAKDKELVVDLNPKKTTNVQEGYDIDIKTGKRSKITDRALGDSSLSNIANTLLGNQRGDLELRGRILEHDLTPPSKVDALTYTFEAGKLAHDTNIKNYRKLQELVGDSIPGEERNAKAEFMRDWVMYRLDPEILKEDIADRVAKLGETLDKKNADNMKHNATAHKRAQKAYDRFVEHVDEERKRFLDRGAKPEDVERGLAEVYHTDKIKTLGDFMRANPKEYGEREIVKQNISDIRPLTDFFDDLMDDVRSVDMDVNKLIDKGKKKAATVNTTLKDEKIVMRKPVKTGNFNPDMAKRKTQDQLDEEVNSELQDLINKRRVAQSKAKKKGE